MTFLLTESEFLLETSSFNGYNFSFKCI